MLPERFPNFNSPGAALLSAAYSADLEEARVLLKHGAMVDAVADNGFTPLMAAVENRDFLIVRLLLRAGARPDREDADGRTVVFHLLSPRGPDIYPRSSLRALVGEGANINAVDYGKRTVLDFWQGRKRWDMAQLFEKFGAR